MATSPRHINLANARIANATSTTAAAEITKLVRQHYDPPPAPPYKYEKVCQKTSRTLLYERPDSTWEDNYYRRAYNMKCGYNSLPNEPYKLVGGHFDLDPYDLVLNTMSDHLNMKIWEHVKGKDGPTSKARQTPVSKKRRQSCLPSAPSHGTKIQKEEQSYNEERWDGGRTIIRNQLRDMKTTLRKVWVGETFENCLQQLQDLKVNKSNITHEKESDNLSMSDVHGNVSKMCNDKLSDKGRSVSCMTDHSRGRSETSNKEQRRCTYPDIEHTGSEFPQGPATSALPAINMFTGRHGSSRNTQDSDKLSAASFFPVIDISYKVVGHREKLKRIHMEFLEALNVIIDTLFNMKTRDLKLKTPLSIDHLKQLRRATVTPPGGDGRETRLKSRPSKSYRNASVISVGSRVHDSRASNLDSGTPFGLSGRRKTSMVEQMTTVQTKLPQIKKFDRHGKHKDEGVKLESWEDLLAVDPYHHCPRQHKKKSFGTGFQMLVRAVQHSKRVSVTNNVGISSVSGDNSPPESEEGAARMENVVKNSEPVKKPVKKIPIWQKIAVEKPVIYEENKSHKKHHVDPEDIVSDMKLKFTKIKQKHELETEAEMQKLERERLLVFRYKYELFDQMGTDFDQYVVKLAKARNNIIQSIDVTEVKPSMWYEELKARSIAVCGPGDDVDSILSKIGRHATMDGKSVHLGKAKLCMIVMSLPAYEICTVAYQTAIKFVLETIMLHDIRNLTDWLELRKVPNSMYDTKDREPVLDQDTAGEV